jgi:hypothetical protein
VENVLGVIGLALFIVGMISLAAGVTWLVVKVSPMPSSSKKTST